MVLVLLSESFRKGNFCRGWLVGCVVFYGWMEMDGWMDVSRYRGYPGPILGLFLGGGEF